MKPKKQSGVSSNQRTIDTFVVKRPVTPTKRKQDDDHEDLDNKRTKPNDSVATTTPLTPEQKESIKTKQMTAQLKLLSKSHNLIDPTSIGLSWYVDLLSSEFKKPYFKTLDDFYAKSSGSATVYPARENIFSWTRHCDIRDVKVVILGQDPYHGPGQAHGLCFSVVKGVPAPPSLVNMYKELVSDTGVPGFIKVPDHGCLVGWAQQGVLLLNAVLTVEASKPNSHKDKGWETMTTSVIKWISNNLKDVVFLLWGSYAQKKASVVDKNRHVLLQAVHPSPLSAHRGFFGCKHFSKCNEILVSRGKEPIRWEHL